MKLLLLLIDVAGIVFTACAIALMLTGTAVLIHTMLS